MANDRIKLRGIAVYPKTDQGYTWSEAKNRSLPDPAGKYECKVTVDLNAAQAAIAKIKEMISGKVKKLPYEINEEENTVTFKTGNKAQDKDGKKKSMPHFDSKGRPLPSKFRLTSGSEVILTVHPYQYKAQGGGITLYLDTVQVVKYIPFQAGPGAVEDADDDSFVYEDDEDDTEAGDTADDINEDAEEKTDEEETGDTNF